MYGLEVSDGQRAKMTAVGFEPTPLRTGAWSQRLRPLGQTVTWQPICIIAQGFCEKRGQSKERGSISSK